MSKTIVAKKTCCKDKPRCKKCPVTLLRLSDAGFAERLDKRTYRIVDSIPKPELKAARRPKKPGSR